MGPCIWLTSTENEHECRRLFQPPTDEDSSPRNGSLLSAFRVRRIPAGDSFSGRSWKETLKSDLHPPPRCPFILDMLQQILPETCAARFHGAASTASVCSGSSSWPLTLALAPPLRRKGRWRVMCLCLPRCGRACFGPETPCVWIAGLPLSRPTAGSGVCR